MISPFAGTPLLASWADWLDRFGWLNRNVPFLEVTLARVIVAFVILLAALVAGRLAKAVVTGYAARLAKADRRTLFRLLLTCLAGPLYVIVFGYGLKLALLLLLENSTVENLPAYGAQVASAVIYLALGWFIYNLVSIAEYYLNRLVGRTATRLDDQLVPLLRKTLRVLIVILVALFIAQNVFQANVGAMLAGLGIGGLAIALAAQDTVANFFGSITILADRPFAVGDRVKIDGADGPVEEVGFRSTKIRTLDGHLVTVPNSKVANSLVENVGKRPFIRRYTNITITYDTPPDKVERAVQIIKDILGSTEQVMDDFLVAFNEFNDWSLNLLVLYKVDPPDWAMAQQLHQKVNLAMMRAFAAEGIEFAFPTSTHYHKTEAPLLVRRADADATP